MGENGTEQKERGLSCGGRGSLPDLARDSEYGTTLTGALSWALTPHIGQLWGEQLPGEGDGAEEGGSSQLK